MVLELKNKRDEQFTEKWLYQIGPAFLGCLPAAFSNSVDNEKAALCGRHVKMVNNDNLKLWHKATALLLDVVKDFNRDAPQYTIHQWLQEQPPTKIATYSKYLDDGVNLSFDGAKSHNRNFFIKDEVLVPPYEGSISNKYPRGIQGLACPTTNIALGPFMHTVSKSFSAQFGSKLSYSSGRNPVELGEWFNQRTLDGYTFYEDDFSEYDSTQGQGAHECEMAVYRLYDPPSCAVNALKAQRTTVGFSKHFKYTCAFTRKSGDQNTSIGNTIVNFAAHVGAMAAYTAKTNRDVDYMMLGLGDDNLLAVKNVGDDFCEFMDGYIRKLGLVPKFKKSVIPSYCSSVLCQL
jgi:hypothetical protein